MINFDKSVGFGDDTRTIPPPPPPPPPHTHTHAHTLVTLFEASVCLERQNCSGGR